MLKIYIPWQEIAQNKVLQGVSSGAGGSIPAGLPNITGSTISNDGAWPYTPYAVGYKGQNNDLYSKGALYIAKNPNRAKMNVRGIDDSNADREDGILSFDASRSNPIYGRSNTVQPNSYKVHFYKRKNK